MSVKVNLLPDVRQAKLQDQQRRQLAITVAIISIVAAAGLLVLGFLVVQGQNLRINQLTSSITKKKGQEASTPNVKDILTTQAKLEALAGSSGLYQQRVIMTKLVNTLAAIEPQDVDFTAISVTNGQLNISAEGKSYLAAAKIAKAIEAANVTTGPNASATNQPFFSNVQLSTVSFSSGKTSYSITATLNQGVTSGQ